MRTWQIDQRVGILGLALGAVLLLTNVALLKQNVELKSRTSGLRDAGFLQPGDSVPMLRGIGMGGEDVVIRYGPTTSKRTLLMVFSPLCSWCTRNMANWEAIVRATEGRSFRLVAVSTYGPGVAEYVAKHPVLQRAQVIAEIDARDQLTYKLKSTPQTLVIGGDGRIEKAWIGALSLDQQADAERFFGTALPGASSPASPPSPVPGG
jgi:hypothetical protein